MTTLLESKTLSVRWPSYPRADIKNPVAPIWKAKSVLKQHSSDVLRHLVRILFVRLFYSFLFNLHLTIQIFHSEIFEWITYLEQLKKLMHGA